jgi:pyridoxine 4-dehydrogenase
MSSAADRAPGGRFMIGGAPVARIGYGAMQLAGPGGRPAPDPARAREVLRRALELGINHVDTASFYGDGLANRLIREALHPYPDGLVLVSKVGAAEDASGALSAAQRPEQLRAQVETDLRQLGVERLGAVNLRRLDHPPGILAEGDQLVDLDSQLAELVALRDEGKIGAIGLSAVSLEQLRQALPIGVACVQNVYSLLDRSGEPLLELCRQEGIAWVPFFPLGSAFPGRPKVTDRPEVIAIADRLDATPAQVGLVWLLVRAPNVLLIPGTTSPEHLQENIAADALELDVAARAELDAIGSET